MRRCCSIRPAVILTVAGYWLLSTMPAPLPAQAPPPEPYTLIPRGYDPNGLMLNPRWATTAELRKLDPASDCGFLGLEKASGYRPLLVRNPKCLAAEQLALLRLSEARSARAAGIVCGQTFDDGFAQGHVNWFPVTLTGWITFNSFSGAGGDYDLTFNFATDSAPPVTSFNWHSSEAKDTTIHLEFDAGETVQRLPHGLLPWWEDFARLARSKRTSGAARALFGPDSVARSVVTGLFGLDLVHGGHAEIHPVYGVALRTESERLAGGNEIRERWMILMRDRGNEGNCASGLYPLKLKDAGGANHFSLLVPAPDGTEGPPTIVAGRSRFVGTSAVSRGPVFSFAPDKRWLQVTLSWAAPAPGSRDALVLGELECLWHVPAARKSSAQSQFVVDSLRAGLHGPIDQVGPKIHREHRNAEPAGNLQALQIETVTPAAETSLAGLLTDWSTSVGASAAAPAPLPLEAVDPFLNTPPVIDCTRVKVYLNPGCKGNHDFALVLGAALWGSDARTAGIGIDFRRAFRPGAADWIPYFRVRTDLQYVHVGANPETATSAGHTLVAHTDVIGGPLPTLLGFYAILGGTAGVGWGSSARFRAVPTFGAGLSLRNGYEFGNVAVELRHDLGCRKAYQLCTLMLRMSGFPWR